MHLSSYSKSLLAKRSQETGCQRISSAEMSWLPGEKETI
jgi:hypothetical protein